MAATLPPSNSSTFLAMPLEIREHIYQLCIPQHLCVDVSLDMYSQDDGYWYDDGNSDENEDEAWGLDNHHGIPTSGPSTLPGLLLICRQITDEVKTLLYGRNTFKVNLNSGGHDTLAKCFTPGTRDKMRKIILVLNPRSVSYAPGFRMDASIWGGILSKASVLGAIVKQPGRFSIYGERLEASPGDFQEWEAWVTPIFEYLVRALPKDTQVVVDANEEKDTMQVLERVSPGRLRFQRIPVADLVFGRGRFSWKSGYYDDPTSYYWDAIEDYDFDFFYDD